MKVCAGKTSAHYKTTAKTKLSKSVENLVTCYEKFMARAVEKRYARTTKHAEDLLAAVQVHRRSTPKAV